MRICGESITLWGEESILSKADEYPSWCQSFVSMREERGFEVSCDWSVAQEGALKSLLMSHDSLITIFCAWEESNGLSF